MFASSLGSEAQEKCQEEDHTRERLHVTGRGQLKLSKAITARTEINLFPCYLQLLFFCRSEQRKPSDGSKIMHSSHCNLMSGNI